ncbi:hypothetical protein OTU49_010860 [Cherax quadricarinatus]|uniref:Protein of centriole 5 n=1 Tax=Cherax quadricarinatus TaxID=27406 RepID=A0AAW0YJI7_CHEQU
MGSCDDESDIEPGSEAGESAEQQHISERTLSSSEGEDHQERNNNNNASTLPDTTPQAKPTENVVRASEMQTENIQGIDDLSSAINSLDDHVQAGLQEIRNCVANLRQERTDLQKRLKTLSDEVYHLSGEKDKYHQAVRDLQQRHLAKIAGRTRSHRLAQSAFSTWRKKVLERNYVTTIHDLEEENKGLRAELLICQEAAKQAFLRSANVLNSEAITMFQDAATRRLGLEDNIDEGCLSSQLSSSSSSIHTGLEEKGETVFNSANKENAGRSQDVRESRKGEERTRSEDKDMDGDFIQMHHSRATLKQTDHSRPYSAFGRGDDREFLSSHPDPNTHQRVMSGHQRSFHYRPGLSSVGNERSQRDQRTDHGAVPKKKPVISDFIPYSLRQETRAFLQQLHDERLVRPEPTFSSSYDPQHTTQGHSSSQDSHNIKSCHCRSGYIRSAHSFAPYKCPYCTPIQNSSFGHAKDSAKKKPEINEPPKGNQVASNFARNVILSGINADKKKVLYKPSASTVIIEKHLNK